MIIKHALAFTVVFTLSFFALPGCNKETPPAPSTGGASSANKDADAHIHDDGTVHSDAPPAAGHVGPVIELGTATIGPFTVRASRDQGEIKAGGDAPIDVWLTASDISKVTAVRFWIGTERGDDFVKAKADIEIPSEPNHWHTHAEVPSPLPAGSKLWVEIEIEGQKQVGSFELKT
jgi:hypothetical protein